MPTTSISILKEIILKPFDVDTQYNANISNIRITVLLEIVLGIMLIKNII